MKVLILVLLVCSLIQASIHPNLLVLNILDHRSVQFASHFIYGLSNETLETTDIYVFMHVQSFLDASTDTKDFLNRHNLRYYSEHRYIDTSIGRATPLVDNVTPILESLRRVLSEDLSAESKYLISIAVDNSTRSSPTSEFSRLFHRLDAADVLLLQKTSRLTSPSDWRDVQIVGMNIQSTGSAKWLRSVHSVFRHYANRTVFNMLNPRPALLEANLRQQGKIQLQYISLRDVCVLFSSNIPNPHNSSVHVKSPRAFMHESVNPADIEKCAATAAVTLHCYGSDHRYCSTINEPIRWRYAVPRELPDTYNKKAEENDASKPPIYKTNLAHGIWHGSLRFRNSSSLTTPKDFCWVSGDDNAEVLADVRIYEAYNKSYVFSHDEIPVEPSTGRFVILSAQAGNAAIMERRLYMHISKQYYCHRHGYKCLMYFSNPFADYLPREHFVLLKHVMGEYQFGLLSKPLMVLDAMFNNPAAAWIVWTDDDVWINPGWLHLTLESFVKDVPEHKIYIQGNYRSAFTNVFFIRNSRAGRKLMFDWIAIEMSGQVQCHGWDQAALGLLVAQRIEGGFYRPNPLNHTCFFSDTAAQMGCNSKGDWSCDFKFEHKLFQAGFKMTDDTHFFSGEMSSYTYGCANIGIPDFHVLSETKTLPRLNCGLCSRAWAIGSTGHWDGPNGGGNNYVRLNAMDSWFFNHKAPYLFYELYLNQSACKKDKLFLPQCNMSATCLTVSDAQFYSPSDWEAMQVCSSIVSLVDGIAYDLNNYSFCLISDEAMLQKQKSETYMKEYEAIIEAANMISDEKWKDMYQGYAGGEGRRSCTDDLHTDKTIPERIVAICGGPHNVGPDGLSLNPGMLEDARLKFERADEQGCRLCHFRPLLNAAVNASNADKSPQVAVSCRHVNSTTDVDTRLRRKRRH